MSVAFADTFYYLALLSKSDVAHERAINLATSQRLRTVTTDWIITEVGDALSGIGTRKQFGPFVEKLRESPHVTIVPFSRELLDEGIRRYVKRNDKDWPLTDCISFIVMEQRGLVEALTGDHHFAQAGFRLLL
ncbi:MAG TPA: PIN domain-containing protein [Phycisphaerae bacterium]|nr:PIN domain-containing protein [Phycisphaerae bacterium]